MTPKEALTFRDIMIRATIRERVLKLGMSVQQNARFVDVLDEAFAEGARNWADDYLPTAIGKEQAEEILSALGQ